VGPTWAPGAIRYHAAILSEGPVATEIADLRTLRDLVRWGASRFNEAGLVFGHGTDNALDEALQLVLHAVHLDHDLTADFLDARLTAAEREAAVTLLRRRVDERIPAAYLTHRARFAGEWYYVDDNVLVPRSPIAELIEGQFAPWVAADAVHRILDLCTGSGCIAIACAHAFPAARVDAVELSAAAAAVARRNVREHGVEGRVRVLTGDLFAPVGPGGYDLIVSNPPYVSEAEMAGLPAEYRREPALGLAAGADGLDVVRRILAAAPRHLTPDGILVVEVGDSAERLAAAYPAAPFCWVDFERGGGGVFVLTAAELAELSTTF
jgi:ribosomal protein L3 glutamine methyltransferase